MKYRRTHLVKLITLDLNQLEHHLNASETDLHDMVRNIEFKKVSSEIQSNLSKDIKRINEDLYFLFLLTKRTTCISFLRTIITNY